MHPGLFQSATATTEEPGLVSGRFLSDLFRSLERHNIPATQLLGDLPIPVDEAGRVTRPVEWADFVDFLKRLENHVGGPEGLETCGQGVVELKPARVLQSLVGISASPYSLYRGASIWALRRAMPGVQTRIEEVAPNRIEIHVLLADGLRPCPQLFHLATGGARALPRILGMADAVVSADIGNFKARYQITVPPSQTIWARMTRIFRTVFSAGSVLQFLEAQQLELHAKHVSLQKTHAALAKSERRYRAITDSAVDVLFEINELGQIEYASPSIQELIGYSPEQVMGSHFSLWVPGGHRSQVKERFETLISQSIEQPITREHITLHTDTGQPIVAEFSLRSYRTPEGELRMVGILRDELDRPARNMRRRQPKGDASQSPTLASGLTLAVDNVRHTTAGHRIEKSLAALMAALETHAADQDDVGTNKMIAATERMTKIVESAMVHTSDPSLSFDWLETKKLTDMVESEFSAQHPGTEFELQVEAAETPALVWGHEALLAAGIGSLLDWAAGRSDGSASAKVVLRIEATGDRASSAGHVVFSVSSLRAQVPVDAHNASPSQTARETTDSRSSLALATAEDAANALGGDLVLPNESTRPATARIRLPQPHQNHQAN